MTYEDSKNMTVRPSYFTGPLVQLTCDNKPIYVNKHMISSMKEIIDDRENCIKTEIKMLNEDVYHVKELTDQILRIL